MNDIQNHIRTPRIAILDHNTLAAMGLQRILQDIVPAVQVDICSSFIELEVNHADGYFHYFVSMSMMLENSKFFIERRHKTIVLTTSHHTEAHHPDFHYLCVNTSEKQLVRSLLLLLQKGHQHGKNLPVISHINQKDTLTKREVEVLVLIVKGHINKEIADQLHISITTVITHRKNIVAKLGMRNVGALTIYAVMHGYVDISSI